MKKLEEKKAFSREVNTQIKKNTPTIFLNVSPLKKFKTNSILGLKIFMGVSLEVVSYPPPPPRTWE
jgi:hypothetical protein